MADYCSFNVEIIGEGVDGPLLVLNSMIVEEFDGLYVDMDKMFPDKDDVSREQWIELARLPERQGRQVTIGGWTKYCPPFGMVERLSVLYPNLLFNLKGTTEHVLHEGWQYMSGECRQEYECLWLHREDVYECTVLDGVRLERPLIVDEMHFGLPTRIEAVLMCPEDFEDGFEADPDDVRYGLNHPQVCLAELVCPDDDGDV